MNAKLINSAAGVLAAFLAVTVLPRDQNFIGDALSDDLISPWCRIGAPETWEGRPCVVPYTESADGTALPRFSR
jgi:hypothetical protein